VGDHLEERLAVVSFGNVPREGLRIHLDLDEARLLRELLSEMKMLLEADLPQEDVTKRLFPDAYEDEAESRAYKDLVGDELRAAKLAALRTVSERLGRRGPLNASLPHEEVDAWLTLLTDLRLAIGTRLGVTEEKMDAEVDPDDPDARALSVLHWLGWVQGSMLEALET